jgi:LysR family hydrogen peroxide-inducible transcriptional activator
MTLTQLEYALTLHKFKSFRKASERLRISQPGLSLQIKKLEEEIGIDIFNRATNPVTTTSDGEQFLIRAEEIVTNAERLKTFAKDLQSDFSGNLRVGIIPTLAPFLVPLFSLSLQNDYPNFELEIQEALTEQILSSVRDGSLDVGIISTPVNVYGVKSIPLFYERFYFYSSTKVNGALSVKKIDIQELWMLEEGNCFRDQVSDFCDLKTIRQNRKFIYRSNSIDALVRMVDTHGGLTILPELTTLSLDEEQEEHLVEISGKPKAREIGMVVTQHYDKVRFIEKLKEYIQKNIPSHMLNGEAYEVVDPHITFQ